MIIKSGSTFYGTLATCNPTTGEGTDPTAVAAYIYRNGVKDTNVIVTVTDDGTNSGIAKLSGTLPSYTAGDLVELVASATVNNISAFTVLWRATVLDDYPLTAAGAAEAVWTYSGTVTTRPSADYPTAITYLTGTTNINTVTWASRKVWNYIYVNNKLDRISETQL